MKDAVERSKYLDEACGGDTSLRTRIEQLLHSYDEAAGFLETADGEKTTEVREVGSSALATQVGQQIGRYKLLQLIGEGGFGVVYMAEQREPVRRKVAVKIIKLGMDTRQVIARFEAERQALAMMDHPNIAKVLDAGATDSGRPYFVMEYIRGVPIVDYCDTEKLDTTARLKLFQSVCNAIQHAHQKGIIHRDVKPSNVLITMHDGKPVPKVIDFGIAKATNHRLTEKTLFTQHRQMIGTPAYMSPEQAEMSGLDIDTRSDIYSLGVLLYELLTGTTPFANDELMGKGYEEMMRIIREVEPHKPSTRISTLGETATRTAHQRHVGDVRKLGLILRGDLDWIVMKALEKDRTRRYETANGFAMDIERYLGDEPVTATPPSAGYRFKKLVRRNKGAFAAAAVVFLVLTLGVVGTTWGMFSARAEFERAERELTRANEVKRLITEMLQGVDPVVAQTADTTLIRRILATASDRLAAGHVADELVAADLHRVIGNVYTSIALYQDAERHLRLAIAIHERLLGVQHSETRKSIWALGSLLLESNRFREAEAIFAPMVADATRSFGEEHPDVLLMMTNLAWAYAGQSRYAEAEALYRRTLNLKRRVLGVEDPATLRCMNNLAATYWSLQRYAEAEPLMTETFDVRERTLGPEHPETLSSAANLANLYRMQGKHVEAEQIYSRTIPVMRNVLGEGHPDLILVLHNLADLYARRDRLDDAAAILQEVVDGCRRTFGNENEQTLGAMCDLGRIYNAQGRYEDALEQLEPCLVTMKRVLGEHHNFIRNALDGLSIAHARLGHFEEARRLHDEADRLDYDVAEQPGTPPNELNKVAWHSLTCGYQELRDPARALLLAQRACSLEEANGGENLWAYLDTLALAQHMSGDTAAAVETQKRAISLMPEGRADPETQQRLAEYEAALAGASAVGDENDSERE